MFMATRAYPYILVGGGLAAASAVEGIRERDRSGDILLICAERHLPYHRPPLSKQVWFGKKKPEEIFVHDQKFYDQRGVTIRSGVTAKSVDAARKQVVTSDGATFEYQKL